MAVSMSPRIDNLLVLVKSISRLTSSVRLSIAFFQNLSAKGQDNEPILLPNSCSFHTCLLILEVKAEGLLALRLVNVC